MSARLGTSGRRVRHHIIRLLIVNSSARVDLALRSLAYFLDQEAMNWGQEWGIGGPSVGYRRLFADQSCVNCQRSAMVSSVIEDPGHHSEARRPSHDPCVRNRL